MAQPRTSFPGLFPKTNGRGKSLGTRLEITDPTTVDCRYYGHPRRGVGGGGGGEREI